MQKITVVPSNKLTRIDRDGIPSIVQSLRFDPKASVYRVEYFDGTYTILRSPIQVNLIGTVRTPSAEDWERVECEAVDKYVSMRTIRKYLSLVPSYWTPS